MSCLANCASLFIGLMPKQASVTPSERPWEVGEQHVDFWGDDSLYV